MSMRIGIALALGIAIAAVDNLAFGGETSPIVIFGLLLVATGLIGLVWRTRGWLAAAISRYPAVIRTTPK